MNRKLLQTFLLTLWVLIAPMAHAAMVNINKADAAAMVENLQGIGPKKASAIVAYRKKNGSFKSLDDLMNVKGIGEKLLKKNRRDLSLSKGVTKAEGKPKKTTTKSKASTKSKKSSTSADKSRSTSSSKKPKKKTGS